MASDFLEQCDLAVVSLGGLAILLSLKKSSGVVAAGLSFAIVILAGGAGFLLSCLAYRAKLMPMVLGINGFITKIRHKAKNCPFRFQLAGNIFDLRVLEWLALIALVSFYSHYILHPCLHNRCPHLLDERDQPKSTPILGKTPAFLLAKSARAVRRIQMPH